MEEIGNFIKIGGERIKIINLVRYRERVEYWLSPGETEEDKTPMVAFCIDLFHDMGNGIVNQDTISYSEPQNEAEPKAQADRDTTLAELDVFFTGYKAKEGYGEKRD
jgi:hypothetical protein